MVNHPGDIREPYEALARIYDFVMRHVDYRRWALYVEGIFRRFGFVDPAICDLACGTGSLALELWRLGYTICGMDRSEAMLSAAREKSRASEAGISFYHMDLKALEGGDAYDVVLCLYDSLNYLRSPAEIERVFESIWKLLRGKGLFIFDVCTESNSLRYFRDHTEKGRGRGFSYARHSSYDRETRCQINDFGITFKGDPTRYVERHEQRIYTLQEIRALIECSRFELRGTYDGFTLESGDEDSDRVHFVLRRA
jgi:SAM-dependent methyltransferase